MGFKSANTACFETNQQSTGPQNLLNSYWNIKIYLHATSTSLCMPDKWSNVYTPKNALCQSINRILVCWTNTTKTSHEACPICCNKMSSGDNSIFYSNKLTNGYFIFQVSFYGSCCVALIQHVRMWPVFLIRFREQNLLCSLYWLSVIYRSLQPLCFNVVL